MIRLLQVLRLKMRATFRRRVVDRELRDELQAHLDRSVEEYIANGMSLADARAAAMREFGSAMRVEEECRDARGINWLTYAAQDCRYGLRLLGRTPGFTFAVVLTIALGLGATTAIVSVVYGVVLRPLPFAAPDRLVALWTSIPRQGFGRTNVSPANARDWRAQNSVFEDIALVRPIGNLNLTGRGEPERLQVALISANLLPVLGVQPMLGRGFTEDEDDVGHDDVVLLSYGLWKQRFGGDPSIVGRPITLSGKPMIVAGVMGPEFFYPSRDFQVWRPLTINPDDYRTRSNYSFLAVARLKPSVTIEAARAEMRVISAQLEQQYPDKNAGVGVIVEPLLASIVVSVRRSLFMLLAAVSGMLLIGCANVANLFLTRSLARQRELAVRTALGASRSRLLAQTMCEVAPMFCLGGLAGVGVARLILDAIVPLLPPDMPRVETIAMDLPVLSVSAAVLAGVAIFTACWPAIELARHAQRTRVAELTRATTPSPRHTRARTVLVVGQVALTLLLLVVAGLLARSFLTVADIHPGFEPERVLTMHVAIPRTKYPTDRAVAAFCEQIVQHVSALPGVEAAGMVNRLPLAGGVQIGGVIFEGDTPGRAHSSDWRSVTADYFRAMGIPLLAGRAFTAADTEDAPRVGIIDERLARAVYGDRSPIGRRFRASFDAAPWVIIVGVVGHIRHDSLEADARSQVYWPSMQRAMDRMALVVKTHGEPSALTGAVAHVVRAVDPEQPVYDVRTLAQVVHRSIGPRLMQTTLLGAFALLALLLAAIGIYGVIAYAVGQRLREFGIRIALGAERADVVLMVLGHGLRTISLGIGIGLVAAIAVARALASLLFGVGILDIVSFSIATLILAGVALVACYLPARRGAHVDPTVALRAE